MVDNQSRSSDKRIDDAAAASNKRINDAAVASDKRLGDLIASIKELRSAEYTLTLSKISQLESKLSDGKMKWDSGRFVRFFSYVCECNMTIMFSFYRVICFNFSVQHFHKNISFNFKLFIQVNLKLLLHFTDLI